MDESRPPDIEASNQWRSDRTTFQRVYDVLSGTTEPVAAAQFAEWADCSENGAREALAQLVEMGIAERTESHPVTYRRNPSYFRWKRVERLARDHSPVEIRSRLDELAARDTELQEQFGVPDPDAVVENDPIEDHDALHDRLDDLSEWRTIRRDIIVLRRALQRAESDIDGQVRP